jgi:hypothetical protein
MQLSLDEYKTAGSILQMVLPSLSVLDIDIAYSKARELVSSVEYNRSLFAIMVWCGLSNQDIEELLLAVTAKELAQIITRIDADDSVIDFFGWLMVAKMHGVNVRHLLHRLYNNCQSFICRVEH